MASMTSPTVSIEGWQAHEQGQNKGERAWHSRRHSARGAVQAGEPLVLSDRRSQWAKGRTCSAVTALKVSACAAMLMEAGGATAELR